MRTAHTALSLSANAVAENDDIRIKSAVTAAKNASPDLERSLNTTRHNQTLILLFDLNSSILWM